ncbi:hypothetical protein FRB94_014702 [Tulasnella sp. JGI-2019a]|nr:hypothetical protein FRB94_014702 [Tulasnella sp. JGI-2019a]
MASVGVKFLKVPAPRKFNRVLDLPHEQNTVKPLLVDPDPPRLVSFMNLSAPTTSEGGPLNISRNPSTASIASGAGTNVSTKRPNPITVRRRVVDKTVTDRRTDTGTVPNVSPVGTAPVSSLQPEILPENRRLIACRLISTDQWLTTHVDASWTVRFTKIYLLIRCADPSKPFPPPELRPPPPPPPKEPFRLHRGRAGILSESSPQYLFPSSPPPITTSTPLPSGPSTPFASSSTNSPINNPHSRTNTDLTTQSSTLTRTSRAASISQDIPEGRSTGSSRTSSDGSDSDIVFAHHPDDESEGDEDFFFDHQVVGVRKSPHGLHPKRTPRRTKSGTLSLSGIGGKQITTTSLTFHSSATTQSLMYDSSRLTTSAPGLGASQSLASQVSEDISKKLDLYMNRRGAELGADGFVMCSFSTGQTLEEHMTLEALRIRPGELLEIQRKHGRIHLPRISYEMAYFETPALIHAAQEKPPGSGRHHKEALSSLQSSFDRAMDDGSAVPKLNSAPSQQSSFADPSDVVHQHHGKQPRRSPSSHFKKSSSDRSTHGNGHPSRGGSNGSSFTGAGGGDERERWRAENYVPESNGGFLPQALAESPISFPSLHAIGAPMRKGSISRASIASAEMKASVDETTLKAKNWKDRWVVIREGTVIMGKDRLMKPQYLEHFDLAHIRSVQESPIPLSLRRQYSHAVNPSSVTVTWSSKALNNVVQPTTGDCVTRFWLFDEAAHNHLFRILSCALKWNQSRAPPTPRPTRISNASSPVPSSLPAKLPDPPPSTSSYRPIDPQMSPSRSMTSTSDALSQSASSLDDASDTAERSRWPLRPARKRLPSSLNVKSRPVTPAAEMDLDMGTDTESDDNSSFHPQRTLTNSRASSLRRKPKNRRLSLGSAIRLGPPDSSSAPKSSGWRQSLLSQCIAAGKGDSVLKGVHEKVACSRWQIDDRDGEYASSREGAKAEMGGRKNSRVNDDTISEYEWENWKREIHDDPGSEVTVGQRSFTDQATAPPPPPGPMFSSNYTTAPHLQAPDTRRGSVPHISSPSQAFPGRTLEPPSLTPATPAQPSFTDVVAGRARSRSTTTVKQSPNGLAPIDTTGMNGDRVRTRTTTSPSPSPISSTQGTDVRRASLLSRSSSKSRRSRSSTIAVAPSGSSFSLYHQPPSSSALPSPTSPKPSFSSPISVVVPSIASGGLLRRKKDNGSSDDSHISLTEALELSGPPLEPSKASGKDVAKPKPPAKPRRRPGTAEFAASALSTFGALATFNPTLPSSRSGQQRTGPGRIGTPPAVAPLMTHSVIDKSPPPLASPNPSKGRPRAATNRDTSYAQMLKAPPTTKGPS